MNKSQSKIVDAKSSGQPAFSAAPAAATAESDLSRGVGGTLPDTPAPAASAVRKSRTFMIVSWVLVVSWAAFIFFMSSRSDSGLEAEMGFFSTIYQAIYALQANLLGPGVDALSPLAHFCEYAIFGALLVNALRCHMPLRKAVLFAILFASFYGVTDEFHQSFVPGRMCDPVDWLVDTLGATLGAFITHRILRR